MTNTPPAGVVVDTMVISWLFDERPNPLAERYRDLIGPAPVLLAFQTVMELRFGASVLVGENFRRRFERRVAGLTVLQPDDEMVLVCAQLRAGCARAGHTLGDKLHDGDRWIASAAIRLGLPLVSHDGVFKGAPGLQLISATVP